MCDIAKMVAIAKKFGGQGAGGSGGSQMMEVNVIDDYDAGTKTCDKTVEEIATAYYSGILPICKVYEKYDGEKYLTDIYTTFNLHYDYVVVEGEETERRSALFSRLWKNGEDYLNAGIFIREDGTVEHANDKDFASSRLHVRGQFFMTDGLNEDAKKYRITVNSSGQLIATQV